MKEIRKMKERSTTKPEVADEDDTNEKFAALKIQKVWKGYITRCHIRKRRLEEMLLIGNKYAIFKFELLFFYWIK